MQKPQKDTKNEGKDNQLRSKLSSESLKEQTENTEGGKL